jgi:hypothetical protein
MERLARCLFSGEQFVDEFRRLFFRKLPNVFMAESPKKLLLA